MLAALCSQLCTRMSSGNTPSALGHWIATQTHPVSPVQLASGTRLCSFAAHAAVLCRTWRTWKHNHSCACTEDMTHLLPPPSLEDLPAACKTNNRSTGQQGHCSCLMLLGITGTRQSLLRNCLLGDSVRCRSEGAYTSDSCLSTTTRYLCPGGAGMLLMSRWAVWRHLQGGQMLAGGQSCTTHRLDIHL
jgi:hypothetical protein